MAKTETTGAQRSAYPALEKNCAVEAVARLVGGKYKSLILWRLMNGTMRFSALGKAVPCATPKMLTQQLRELESDGFIHREMYPVVPPRVEYSLTEFGRSFRPVLEAMHTWGTAYLARQKSEPSCGDAGSHGREDEAS